MYIFCGNDHPRGNSRVGRDLKNNNTPREKSGRAPISNAHHVATCAFYIITVWLSSSQYFAVVRQGSPCTRY